VSSGGATVVMMVRVVVSLGLVMGMCWGATWALKRRGGGGLGLRSADRLEVLERRALSKGAAVAIVRVAGEDYLVGVTDHSVTLLQPAPGAQRENDTTVDLTADAAAAFVTTSDAALGHTAATGTRRTGSQMPSVGSDGPTRMGFVEALRELTVRRS
jgi:flagellar biosynthetic protein FliO